MRQLYVSHNDMQNVLPFVKKFTTQFSGLLRDRRIIASTCTLYICTYICMYQAKYIFFLLKIQQTTHQKVS